MAKFEFRRRYPGEHISRVFDDTGSRGLALGHHDSDESKAALAQGDSFLGFLTRDVTENGPELADHVYPLRIELPFASGGPVSLEKADEVEAEGTEFLKTSGTGEITGSTAVGSALSFEDGKFYVAQGSDQVFYRLSAQLEPEDAGEVRIRAEIVR